MDFYVQQAVLDSGVKIVFARVEGLDNSSVSPAWMALREEKLAALKDLYAGIDVHADPVLEGFNILHDNTGVRRRKNIPASENLIKLLNKHGELPFINQVVDIYNIISLESKLALGAHNIDAVEGNFTLRFTDGSERYQPIGQPEPIPVDPHEYCYCDDSNEVLCRLEVRQVEKTKVDETAQNVAFICQGNEATSWDYVQETAQQIVDLITRYCGGSGRIEMPQVI